MKIKFYSFSFVLVAALALATSSACVSQPTARDISSLAESFPGGASAKRDAAPQYRGCEDGLAATVGQRSAIVDQAVRQAESELAKNPSWIKDPDFRARVATFAAATVDDMVPLITLDRSCWAEFYDGQKNLAAGDEAGAKENGDAWRICLEAMFPDRIAIARPYFNCFAPEASKPATPSDF